MIRWWYEPVAFVVLGITVAAIGFYMVNKEQPNVVVGTVAPVVANVGTQEITPPKVIAFKPAAKAKTKLPQAVQSDPQQHVIAATKVDSSERPQLVTTVIDGGTGESTTYVVQEPTPWLGFRDRGEVSLAYGIKKEGTVVRLAARQELLQIKSLGLGGVGHIDSDGDYFVGAGVSYRW